MNLQANIFRLEQEQNEIAISKARLRLKLVDFY